MYDLFVFAAQNSALALLLGMVVYGLTRVWRNPPVAHVLWILVLLKLVAPPVLGVDWPVLGLLEMARPAGQIVAELPDGEGANAEPETRFIDQPTSRSTTVLSPASVPEQGAADNIWRLWTLVPLALLCLWISGTALVALVIVMRIARFERLLRDTLPAPERLQRVTAEIAAKLGVRRVPDVRCVECVDVPVLWCAGRRPTILLPMRLVSQVDEQSVPLLLAHEIAHVRRRDHWVRVLELVVTALYWWNPLPWMIRRQIRQAEDQCCDAWVRWAFPDCVKHYAEVLLQAAESLGASLGSPRLLPASPFLHSLSLKARIEMILESRFAPSISTKSMAVVILVAALVLPTFIRTTKSEAWAGTNDQAAEAAVDTAFLSQRFKHRVPFEIGQTQTRDGGRIEIREVWGTRPHIEIGGQYLVRGRYVLPAGERGKLYFYATAGGAWGQTASLDLQSIAVDKQEGDFELVHGMAGPGEFHLILTDAERYSRWFANVYFSNGDDHAKKSAAGAKDDGPAATAINLGTPGTPEGPQAVRFEQGVTRFLDGDKITIQEIRGTADTFLPGNIYWIKGTYALASHERATVAAYITAMDAENGRSASIRAQSTVVDQGDGTFTLFLPMPYRGWPHVSFYPAGGGDGFGGNYFGTGDSVLK